MLLEIRARTMCVKNYKFRELIFFYRFPAKTRKHARKIRNAKCIIALCIIPQFKYLLLQVDNIAMFFWQNNNLYFIMTYTNSHSHIARSIHRRYDELGLKRDYI